MNSLYYLSMILQNGGGWMGNMCSFDENLKISLFHFSINQ